MYIDKIVKNKIFLGADTELIQKVVNSDLCFFADFVSGQEIDISERLAFVAQGEVCVYSVDSKRNLLLRKVSTDEIFGVACLFSQKKNISRCFAKGKTKILFFSKAAVSMLVEKDKTIMYNYISLLSSKICYLNEKITYLTAGNTERKLASFLCSFESDEIRLGVNFSVLSDMLDIARASLYRAFDRFEKDGCIKKDGQHIRIINKALMLEKY